MSMKYPNFRVSVLDGERRHWLADLCAQKGCHYLSRPDNSHAKPGNINHAVRYLAALSSPPDFVAVLDADFVPFSLVHFAPTVIMQIAITTWLGGGRMLPIIATVHHQRRGAHKVWRSGAYLRDQRHFSKRIASGWQDTGVCSIASYRFRGGNRESCRDWSLGCQRVCGEFDW